MTWAVLFFVLAALPGDLRNIWGAIFHPSVPELGWQLALGLSIKTATGLLSVIGLFLGRSWGWAFLLVSSLQCLLVQVGSLMGGGPNAWNVSELTFRVFCLAAFVRKELQR